LEGSIYELLLIFQAISKAGINMNRIVVSGGGSKSRIWLETKADILGKEITTVDCEETGALGSAVLASVKCGYYKTLSEAAEAMVKYKEIIYPNEKFHNLHQQRFQEYKGLYDHLKAVNHMLLD
jgi:xylulokinase